MTEVLGPKSMDVASERLARRIVIAMGATAVVSGVMFFCYDIHSYREFCQQELDRQTTIIGSQLQAALDFGDMQSAEDVLSELAGLDNVGTALILDASHRPLVVQPPDADVNEVTSWFHPVSVRAIPAGDGFVLRLRARSGELKNRIMLVGGFVIAFIFISMSLALFASHRVRTGVVALFEQQRETQKRLQKARERAEVADRAKTDFLANMNHEIRTPLNGMMGSIELLGSSSLEPAQRELVEILRSSGGVLLSVVNDILDFSRVEAGKVVLQAEPCDIRDSLFGTTQLFKPVAQAKGVELQTVVEADVPDVLMIDAVRLRQALSNLVSNALKFTETGRVRVALCRADKPGCYEFSVADQGIGLDAHEIERIFSHFEQADGSMSRSYGGTGLGLPIAQNIVELMGGCIEVQSQKGEGARFSFVVPAEEVASITPTRAKASHRECDATYAFKVLMCEDNRVNAKIAVRMLESIGCSVEVAEDGQAGLQMAMNDNYDLIFMDCQMPRMDGYEATRRILALDQSTPIFALTANILEQDLMRCLESGMVGWVAKPVTVETLKKVLEEVESGRYLQGLGDNSSGWGRFDPKKQPAEKATLVESADVPDEVLALRETADRSFRSATRDV